MKSLELLEDGTATGMNGGEFVKFNKGLKLVGNVEEYLHAVLETMRTSLKDISVDGLKRLG